MTTLHSIADALEQSSIGSSIAGSRLLFPLIEGTHLIGLTLAIGLLFLVDLRLIGLFLRHVTFETLHRQLRPYILTGNAIVFATGFLLVWAEPDVMFAPSFPVKLVLIGIAGLNALYFEFITARKIEVRSSLATASGLAVLPARARAAGWISLSVWMLVIICGRLIAYVPEWP